ncbi:hypothetical protein BU17DRAFT_84118 [Hysterangium stoloniferum]|nr:hypothetical protein BU17DRAFT_84118 [Hysterangium stoloniferum]
MVDQLSNPSCGGRSGFRPPTPSLCSSSLAMGLPPHHLNTKGEIETQSSRKYNLKTSSSDGFIFLRKNGSVHGVAGVNTIDAPSHPFSMGFINAVDENRLSCQHQLYLNPSWSTTPTLANSSSSVAPLSFLDMANTTLVDYEATRLKSSPIKNVANALTPQKNQSNKRKIGFWRTLGLPPVLSFLENSRRRRIKADVIAPPESPRQGDGFPPELCCYASRSFSPNRDVHKPILPDMPGDSIYNQQDVSKGYQSGRLLYLACDPREEIDDLSVNSSEFETWKRPQPEPVSGILASDRIVQPSLPENLGAIFHDKLITQAHALIASSEINPCQNPNHHTGCRSLGPGVTDDPFPTLITSSEPPRLPELIFHSSASYTSAKSATFTSQDPSSQSAVKLERKSFMHMDSSYSLTNICSICLEDKQLSLPCENSPGELHTAIVTQPVKTESKFTNIHPLSKKSSFPGSKYNPMVQINLPSPSLLTDGHGQRTNLDHDDTSSCYGGTLESLVNTEHVKWPQPPRHMLFLDPDLSMHQSEAIRSTTHKTTEGDASEAQVVLSYLRCPCSPNAAKTKASNQPSGCFQNHGSGELPAASDVTMPKKGFTTEDQPVTLTIASNIQQGAFPSPLMSIEVMYNNLFLPHINFPRVIIKSPGKHLIFRAPSSPLLISFCAFHSETKLELETSAALASSASDLLISLDESTMMVNEWISETRAEEKDGNVFFRFHSPCTLGELAIAIARVSFS